MARALHQPLPEAFTGGRSMVIILESDTRIRLDPSAGALEFESSGAALSPFHLLAASLATCTALGVLSWAEQAGVSTDGLSLSVEWALVEGRPARVERIIQVLHWPGLPKERMPVAERIAGLCPIEATLRAGTEVTSRVER